MAEYCEKLVDLFILINFEIASAGRGGIERGESSANPGDFTLIW